MPGPPRRRAGSEPGRAADRRPRRSAPPYRRTRSAIPTSPWPEPLRPVHGPCRPRSAIASSRHGDSQRTVTDGRRGAGVLDRVGERLLHDAVGGEVDAGRAAAAARPRRRASTGSPAARERSTRCVELAQRRLRRRARCLLAGVQDAEQAAHLGQRRAADVARCARRPRPRAPGRGRGSAARRPPARPSRSPSARRRRASRARSGGAPRPRRARRPRSCASCAWTAASCSSSVSCERVRTPRPGEPGDQRERGREHVVGEDLVAEAQDHAVHAGEDHHGSEQRCPSGGVRPHRVTHGEHGEQRELEVVQRRRGTCWRRSSTRTSPRRRARAASAARRASRSRRR